MIIDVTSNQSPFPIVYMLIPPLKDAEAGFSNVLWYYSIIYAW